MPGPYSTEFYERSAVHFFLEVFLEVREGEIWRLRKLNGRPHIPNRIDYSSGSSRHRAFKARLDGEIHSIPVQRMVWQVHKGDIPPGLTVNHKDGDPSNNRIANLELLTQSEQHLHRFRILGHKPAMTMIRDRYAAVVEAAREAVASGQLDGLKEALRAFDEGEARWRKKAS